MKANCCVCLKALKEKGAVVLSPPSKDEEPDNDYIDFVLKYHVCIKCWHDTLRPFLIDKFKEANRKK